MPHNTPLNQNNLNKATSPYLVQHADNPVHWQEWSPELLDLAQSENKPLLISIGYAACHWCHVMAHESFENEDIAALMNKHFISIKIDREERPDLDHIYQSALSMMEQQGGWPLTMFCTPRGVPFWGGTYFPAEAKYGRPGFDDVLARIAQIYRHQPENVSHNAKALGEALEGLGESKQGDVGIFTHQTLDDIGDQILTLIDREKGGVKGAPKFPNPSLLTYLWANYTRRGEQAFKQAVTHSLKKMGNGGIYDHVGGGFARYSVDEDWLVPHFEKMLYDNALLVDLMTLVWQDTKDPFFEHKVKHTISWVLSDMRPKDEKGKEISAFGSSYDADSEGVEGKYYVWGVDEIDSILEVQLAPIFKKAYGMSAQGNFEEAGKGANILNRLNTGEEQEDMELETQLQIACDSLLMHRRKRVAPLFDDKVLVDWNGMMICALARAGRVFEQEQWCDAARNAYEFIKSRLQKDNNGILYHSWHKGQAAHHGLADDYAWMIKAALRLYALDSNREYLEDAQKWAKIMEERFWDKDQCGYFLNDNEAQELPCRPKVIQDSAVPSANGLMVENLALLGVVCAQDTWEENRQKLIEAFAGSLEGNLYGLFSYLTGIEVGQRLIKAEITGSKDNENAEALRNIMRSQGRQEIFWVDRHKDTKVPEAVICQNGQCFEPLKTPSELEGKLRDRELRSGNCFT